MHKKCIGEEIDEDETRCCECGDFTLELNHGFCIDCDNRREYLSEMERVAPALYKLGAIPNGKPQYDFKNENPRYPPRYNF